MDLYEYKYKKYKNKFLNLRKKSDINQKKKIQIGGSLSPIIPTDDQEKIRLFNLFYSNTMKPRNLLELTQQQPSNVSSFIGENYFNYPFHELTDFFLEINSIDISILYNIGTRRTLDNILKNNYPRYPPIQVSNLDVQFRDKVNINIFDVCCGPLNNLVIPTEVIHWRDTIKKCLQIYLSCLNKNVHHENISKFLSTINMYITIMHDIIEPGKSMGLPSFHTDSMLNNHDDTFFTDSFFLASTTYTENNELLNAMPTIMVIPRIDIKLPETFDTRRDLGFLKVLEELDEPSKYDIYKTNNNSISLQDSYTIHTGTINESGRRIKRDFMRVYFSNKSFTGACVNISLARINPAYNNLTWKNKDFKFDKPSPLYTLQLYGIDYTSYWDDYTKSFVINPADINISSTDCPKISTEDKIKRYKFSRTMSLGL